MSSTLHHFRITRAITTHDYRCLRLHPTTHVHYNPRGRLPGQELASLGKSTSGQDSSCELKQWKAGEAEAFCERPADEGMWSPWRVHNGNSSHPSADFHRGNSSETAGIWTSD